MSNQTERILENSAASTVSTVANRPIELQYTVYGAECKETADEQWTDLERSRSCRRSAQCRFSVQPPEPDLQLPRSVLLYPDWLLTTSSSGLKTHSKYTLWHWLHGLICTTNMICGFKALFQWVHFEESWYLSHKKKTTLELCHLFLSPSSLSPSWSFQPGGRPGLCGGFGGWRWQTKVSDRHPWKSLTLGQKSLQGRKKRQTHRNVKASGQRQTC